MNFVRDISEEGLGFDLSYLRMIIRKTLFTQWSLRSDLVGGFLQLFFVGTQTRTQTPKSIG